LEGPDGPQTEQKCMLQIAIYYYKDLFRKDNRLDIRLRSDFFSPEKKVIVQENTASEK
jgi:hypothetical protein